MKSPNPVLSTKGVVCVIASVLLLSWLAIVVIGVLPHTEKAASTSVGPVIVAAAKPPVDEDAVALVAHAIEPNKLKVTRKDLLTKKNPKGEGVFVYVAQTQFYGVEREIVWLVIRSKAFALNSPSKLVTPSLPWPREGDERIWRKTGLNMFIGASEAINILFPKN